MKTLLLLFCICLAYISVQAQRFDLSLAGGFTETLQTGYYSIPVTFSKSGGGTAGALSLRYITKSGVTVGLSGELCKLRTRQGWPITASYTYYGIGYPVDVYFGTSYSVNVLAGYTVQLKKSSIVAAGFFGYDHNSNGSKESKYPGRFYLQDTRGFDYGVALEYQHVITHKLSAGLLFEPTFMRIYGSDGFDASLFSLHSLISLHYRIK